MTKPPSRAEVRALLEEIVRAQSPSGSEAQASLVLMRHLDAWGLRPHLDEAGNVLASVGPADAPHVVLLGHIDTVPGALPVRWEGDTLWGRGAVDAKGPLVAHAIALASCAREELHVTLAATTGEEAASPGARHLATRLAPDAVIIAEPTGLTSVGIGYKGCIKASLTARVEPHHAGAPPPTAAELVLAGVDALTRWTGNPERDTGFTRSTLRVVALGTERDGFHEEATARLDLRLPGVVPDEDELRSALPPGVDLVVHEAWPAVTEPAEGPVATALRSALRARGHEVRPVRKTGTSDWNVVSQRWSCPGAAYGPGDPALDHTPHERVDLDEVLASGAVLTQALTLLPRTLRQKR